MLTARIKIADGTIYDTATQYGLVYLDSDKILGAPIKDFEETSYPEQEGVNICPKTVDAPFDYKVKFFIRATTLSNANAKIKAFNDALYTLASGVKTFKQVTFYNDHKRCMIVGYPKPISEAQTFWRDPNNEITDVVTVEWTIRVNKPSLCNFNLS